MTNKNFLSAYQHLQYGIMYNKLVDLNFASIAWCGEYESSFFNHAQVDTILDQKQLKLVENELMSLNRKPAVYFENREDLSNLVSFIESNGYTKTWEDSWMFHSGEGIKKTDLHETKKVETEEELNEFLDTFDRCYQENDPQNPYGELGNYIDVARKAWNKHKDGKIEYFTVYKDKEPVAVSTLTSFAGIGYISNVGSLKSVRGQGFGKTASLYAVLASVKNGNTQHALATEEGDYPNEFYKRIGFETKFSVLGYVKND